MKNNNFLNIFAGVTLFLSAAATAQSFVPSQQQINQFKNLPRAQQEQLAQQMGFDLSILESGTTQNSSDYEEDELDFFERDLDNEKIASELAKQSVAEESTAKLTPFGYDIFESRDEAAKPSSNLPVPSNYTIGPGDSIKLQLFGKESGDYELLVNNDGNIDLPDLGPLNVAGTSFTELKSLVAQKYEQQKIGVSPFISMGQLRTIQIFLVGEVFRPGPLVVTGLSTITTALINSGGVNEIGSLRNIQLKRQGKTVANFDLYDLIVFGDTSNDVRLEQGDVLFVPTAQNIVSIDGQVRRPAIYEMKPNETIADLFQLVGGFLPNADKNAMQVIRRDSEGLSVLNVSGFNPSQMKRKLFNGDFVRVPKSNQEFNNAIVVNGAINLPNVLADSGLSLRDVINKRTLLSNTDLDYALVARKGRFDTKTTVIQFKPRDVLSNSFNLDLQAYDELIVFNRINNEPVDEETEQVKNGDDKKTKDDFKSLDEELNSEDTPESLMKAESNRFTAAGFERESTLQESRKSLLAPLIARLKDEASSLEKVQLVQVSGQVKYPGVYPLAQNSHLQNLIAAGGGLTEAAHLESAEITRIEVADGVSQIKHSNINLLDELSKPAKAQIKLTSKDVLNVVRIPQWYEDSQVELKGEVVFPGLYQISEGETLSSVIKRAGGLTNKATLGASLFTREELKEKEKRNIDKAIEDLRQQLANNNLSSSQFTKTIDYESATAVLEDLTDVEPLGRMVINLADIVGGKSDADFEVKDGDILIVPNVTPAISVVGEVFVANTFMFNKNIKIDDYIEMAGGIREFADQSKLYVVRANGSVFVPKSSFWFSSETESTLQPGDTIVVPRDTTNYDNLSLWQGVTQIIYQTAVALAAIGSL